MADPTPTPPTALGTIDFEHDVTDPLTGKVTTVYKHGSGAIIDGAPYLVSFVETTVTLSDPISGRTWTEPRHTQGLVPLAVAVPGARLRGA